MYLALASAYPTEAAARNGITENLRAAALDAFRGSQYHGVWRTAPPQCTAVYVFGEVDGARLRLDGWTPEPDALLDSDGWCGHTGPHDHEPDRKADEACPTCTGPSRETVGMVCQTCGTDYGPQEQA